MLRLLLGLLTFITLCPAYAQSLPTPVANRVGRAAVFIYQWTQAQYLSKLGSFDFVWSNEPGSMQGNGNLYFPNFSSGYTAVNRIPAYSRAFGNDHIVTACANAPSAGGCTLAWFQANHPKWVIYKNDQKTPAYQFSDLDWIPLDISNPAVQSWILANQNAPILGFGYASISVDNVTIRNDWDEEGVCSIAPTPTGGGCTAEGGTWTQIYTGALYDTTFISNRASWLQALTTHAHGLGGSTTCNVTYNSVYTTDTATLINACDVWFDEPGFTGDAVPAACTPNGGSGVAGTDWINKVSFITGLNSGSGPNAYVTSNALCPIGAFYISGVNSTFEMVEFAVASYLIVKNSQTYIAANFADASNVGGVAYYNDETPTGAWPQFTLNHGAPSGAYSVTGNVYNRTFANVLALVNPSTTTAYTYNLGAAVYHRSDCTRYTGTIAIPPITGMVLISGEPPRCIP